MNLLSKQAKIGSLKNIAQKMRSPKASYSPVGLTEGLTSRIKKEEDPDYVRKPASILSGKLYNSTSAPKASKF